MQNTQRHHNEGNGKQIEKWGIPFMGAYVNFLSIRFNWKSFIR